MPCIEARNSGFVLQVQASEALGVPVWGSRRVQANSGWLYSSNINKHMPVIEKQNKLFLGIVALTILHIGGMTKGENVCLGSALP